MASIASLALKIQADVGGVLGNLNAVTSHIDRMSQAASSSRSGVRAMEDSLSGMKIMLENANTATSSLVGAIHSMKSDKIQEATDVLNKMNTAAKTVFDATVNGAEASAAAIAKTPPVIKSVNAAIEQMKNLNEFKRLDFGNIGVTGNDLQKINGAMNSLKTNAAGLAAGVAAGISRLEPTMHNIMVAKRQIEELKAAAERVKSLTGDDAGFSAAIVAAEQNMAKLSNRAVSFHMEMESVKSTLFAINNLPFAILSHVFTDVLAGVKTFGSDVDKILGGWPAQISRAVAVVGSLAVVLGLAHARMTELGVSATYFTTLMKSSLIYQGLTGFVSLVKSASVALLGTTATVTATAIATRAWAAAQAVVNAVMALNPYILAAMAVAAIVASIVALVWWIQRSHAAAEQMKNQMLATENATEKFRDSIGGAVDRFRELNNYARQYHEDNLSDVEKYKNKLLEIDEVLDRQNTGKRLLDSLNRKQNELESMLKRVSNDEYRHSLQKQIDDVVADRKNLQKTIDNSPVLSALDAANRREQERINLLKNRFGNLLEKTLTPQEEYAKTLIQLTELTKMDAIEVAERQLIEKNALEKRNKALLDSFGVADLIKTSQMPVEVLDDSTSRLNDAFREGIINAEQLAAGLANARKIFAETDPTAKAMTELKNKFQEMSQKTPVQTFDELSQQLASVKNVLSVGEFAAAQRKLLDDMASGLGIADYLKPAQADATLQSRKQELATVYEKLIQYANRTGMSDNALAAAKDRARAAFEKQSNFYDLYQRVQDSLVPTSQKIEMVMRQIEQEAAAWGWSRDIVAKMKQLQVNDMMGGSNAADLQANFAANRQNAALESGSVAYFSAIHGVNNDQLLTENKKQTAELRAIKETLKGQSISSSRSHSEEFYVLE
jgi:serine/threonine protein phosphatase PrpC